MLDINVGADALIPPQAGWQACSGNRPYLKELIEINIPCHAGLEEPAPHCDAGAYKNPEVAILWIPVFTGMTTLMYSVPGVITTKLVWFLIRGKSCRSKLPLAKYRLGSSFDVGRWKFDVRRSVL